MGLEISRTSLQPEVALAVAGTASWNTAVLPLQELMRCRRDVPRVGYPAHGWN